eukprot:Nitzschia sp. Nitz4//scaffold365_size14809//9197//13081//NITZ4_008914-RA/size14809-snap-gene-0.9-mRNA-1//-1//CDS//3329549289//5210//frame0
MSSNSSAGRGRGPSRGGGRGRGRGGRRGGRGRSNKRSNDRSNGENPTTSSTATLVNEGAATHPMSDLRDEDVLIAFMPYLKGDNQEATVIHELYQSSNDQQAFLRAARTFLVQQQTGTAVTTASFPTRSEPSPSMSIPNSQPLPNLPAVGPQDASHNPLPIVSTGNPPPQNPFPPMMDGHEPHHNSMEALERNMASLLSDMDDEPPASAPTTSILPQQELPAPSSTSLPSSIGGGIFAPPAEGKASNFPVYGQSMPGLPITPQRPSHDPFSSMQSNTMSSPFNSIFSPTPPPPVNNGQVGLFPPMQPPQQSSQGYPSSFNTQPPPGNAASWASPGLVSKPTRSESMDDTSRSPMLAPATPATKEPQPLTSTPGPTNGPTNEAPAADTAKTPAKREFQPKRLWTRLQEQPGKILANNVPPTLGAVVDLRPRQELTAQWMLPISYLRQHAAGREQVRNVRDLLANLAVGLFRRGCTENGSQASIISKEVLTPQGESRNDFPFKVVNDVVVGSVPFYSPRTPGYVVLRLYWQDEPLHTLATGPTLNVRVTEQDFESSIRFILSNFKAKKVNPTSLSSLNALALVLEQFYLPNSNKNSRGVPPHLEGAGRAIWGCLCEARKVLDACAAEYHKTTNKLHKLEEAVEALKAIVDEEEIDKAINSSDDATASDPDEERSENAVALREKQKALMSGRASCERKWRDSQLAFASILKALATNPSMGVILKRDLVNKLRLEYELWCPLTEEFAIPGDSDATMWYEPLNHYPHNVGPDHFNSCTDARSKMQQRSLGFDPNTMELEQVLYPNRGRARQMDPGAVTVFNQLSAAMGQLYQDNFATAEHIIQQREMIRQQTESYVASCDCFPPGTKVAIFGSSANGFGSPKSDLDMCLQIPVGHAVNTDDDPTGATRMAALAKVLEEKGMKDVDISRLTARIPVIKFNCPRPLHDDAHCEDPLMECDLSMHNPLAVLNTSLLRTYSDINPVPRVLAGVIKRWAKARDINNPARHTLSSYGYILMLLHFLTFHERTGNGLVASVGRSDKPPHARSHPLFPNLQWMNDHWPEMQPGTPYTEFAQIPEKMMNHPLEDRGLVNTYFYHPNAARMQNLQRLFPGQDLSLGILLASFFRYYAYEFDYKRNVVSLHSTVSHGPIEREVKAELDGWRNYSAALTIEDPFETFYDVAHVLRGGYYHRIRREFAVAYTKIADVAMGKTTSTWANKTVDLSNMAGMELIDWICEPIASERDENSSQL